MTMVMMILMGWDGIGLDWIGWGVDFIGDYLEGEEEGEEEWKYEASERGRRGFGWKWMEMDGMNGWIDG